jgi:hypothetical protein
MMNDVMAPVSQHDAALSPITLALFKDSGWYDVDYAVGATAMHWGSGAGCTFVSDKCLAVGAPPTSAFERHFCTANARPACTVERKFKGACVVRDWSAALPSPYQYFTGSALTGGLIVQADYCPTVVDYSSGDCRYGSNSPIPSQTFGGEGYSNSSRCFDSTLRQPVGSYATSISDADWPSRCFPSRCNADGSSYSIAVAKAPAGTSVSSHDDFEVVWVDCPDSSTTLGVTGFTGSITCAPHSVVCDGSAADAEALVVKSNGYNDVAPAELNCTVTCCDLNEQAVDKYGDGCSLYVTNPSWCGTLYDDDDFVSKDLCCACR